MVSVPPLLSSHQPVWGPSSAPLPLRTAHPKRVPSPSGRHSGEGRTCKERGWRAGRAQQKERRRRQRGAGLVPGRAGVQDPLLRSRARGDERPLAGTACGRTHRAGTASARATAGQLRSTRQLTQQVGPCVAARRRPGEGRGSVCVGPGPRSSGSGSPSSVVTCSRKGGAE